MANCTTCNKEFNAEDLCPIGRCVTCYDTGARTRQTLAQRDENRKAWKKNNPEKVKEGQQASRQRKREQREESKDELV